ncbi:hypothetical protein EHS25_009787 [Saitozyma podzolica]|uniref:Uncharacterized protein n=1 Tax=Saitozyma podzolica TaxID=1890683 RepID=A0A427YK63_9TREE|nr:hypothetical protein EHS25_009787 [Saitozyma podzolica]
MSQNEPSQAHGTDRSGDQSGGGTLDVGVTVVHSVFANLTPPGSSEEGSACGHEEGQDSTSLHGEIAAEVEQDERLIHQLLEHLSVGAPGEEQQGSSSSTSAGPRLIGVSDLVSALKTISDHIQQADPTPSGESNNEARVYAWLETENGKLTGIKSLADFSTTSKWDDTKWCAGFERELKTRIALDQDQFTRWKQHYTKKPAEVETWWSTRVLAGVKATWGDRGPADEKITFVLKTQKDFLDDLADKTKDGDHQVKFVTNAYNADVDSDDEDETTCKTYLPSRVLRAGMDGV